jgi:glycerophosphoryl diester phosphodiesterase
VTPAAPRLLGALAVLVMVSGPTPLVIAHRGASAEAPEHTRAAYDRAVHEGADVIECDLQLTKDEVLVCMHDTTVDRTAGGTGTGRVDAHTLAELRAMDFGSWFAPRFAGERIVTFAEQLRRYPRARFYVETKAPAEYGGRMEPALVRELRRFDLVPAGDADPARAPVIVQSFDRTSLETVKQLAPSLPTAWLFIAPPTELATGIPDAVDVLAPAADVVRGDPAFVERAHAAGRPVHVWTVDDATEMRELLDGGVDGIFTDRPATLRRVLEARSPRDSAGDVGGAAASTESDDGGGFPWPVVAVGALAAALGLVWIVRRALRRA